MDTLKAILDETIGMFVDDGSLAVAVLAIVAAAGWVSLRFEHAYLVTAAILFLGCLLALAENVIRTVRKATKAATSRRFE